MDLGIVLTGSVFITLGVGLLRWVCNTSSTYADTPASTPDQYYLPPGLSIEQRRSIHFLRYLYEHDVFTPLTKDLPC